jgi:hypothetical protein
MTDTTAQAAEQHKLSRLSRMLGEFEIARDLVDVYGIDTVQAAMELLLANEARDNAGNPEDDDNSGPTTIKGALKNAKGHNSNIIIMGKNLTPVNDTRVSKGPKKFKPFEPKDNSNKAFGAASSRVSSAQKSLASEGMSEAEFLARAKFMSEGGIEDHRNSNGATETLPWAGGQHTPRNVAGKIKVIKDACRKSREAQTEEDPYKLNHVAESFLSKKAAESKALKEAALTPAQKTIATHARPSEESVANRLPASFRSNALSKIEVNRDNDVAYKAETSIRMKDYDTRSAIPDYWKPKLLATTDNSYKAQYRRMQADTKAGQSLDKGKPQFTQDNSKNQDGSTPESNRPFAKIPDIEPPIKDGEPSMGANTLKNHQNQERQWDVSLSRPKRPVQDTNPQGSPYTGAI